MLAGANILYKRPYGYDALLDAVHGRDTSRDDARNDLLSLLSANGVDLNGITSCQESALRVLSRIGRFDSGCLLLGAGADQSQPGWTPLMETVALGSLTEVAAVLTSRPDLEHRD